MFRNVMHFPDPALFICQQYLLSAYYVPGATLGAISRTQSPSSPDLYKSGKAICKSVDVWWWYMY